MVVHRIQRVTIELTASDRALAESLLARAGRLHDPHLLARLDRVCSDLSGPGSVDRLDRLEVDLGSLPADTFDDALLAAVERAVRDALAAALRARPRDPPAAAALELLASFARIGVLPWFADRATRPDPVAAALTAALADAPQDLLRLLHDLAADPPALARLSRHCPPATLRAVLAARFVGDADGPALRRALEPILAGPVAPGLRDALLIAAASPGTTARALLADLASGGLARPAGGPPPLVIRPPDAAAVAKSAHRTPDRVAPGTVAPARDASHRTPPAHPAPAAPDRLDASTPDPSPLRAGAHALPRPPSPARDRLGPADPAPPARPDPRTSSQDNDRGLVAAASSAAPPPVPGAGDAAHTAQADVEPVPAVVRVVRPQRRPAHDPHAAVRRRILEAQGELLVDDAGLVLLWPFLDRFFARLGLLDEQRRFVDDPAQVAAVHLLELLATGDPDPPEFHLPLAKLLCGRPIAAPCALPDPLAPAAVVEADRLLAAVLDQIPPLRRATPAGFRDAFLARPGVLTTRDGVWLLRVERRAHDLLLERFPWPWSWIRLPWMPDPLQVEW